jgi:hypothetical protein
VSNAPQLVQKLWNYCNILRDDGLSYGDYVEQLTYLLFLKMAEEQAQLRGGCAQHAVGASRAASAALGLTIRRGFGIFCHESC